VLTDTHCHVDQFESPEALIRECAAQGISVVAVTNLPSHYELAVKHLTGVPAIHPALGLHPLAVANHGHEIVRFLALAPAATHIGEIGLDFSYEGRSSRKVQEEAFTKILLALAGRQRFVTIHSRGAEKEVLDALSGAGLCRAVFHWYSGSLQVAEQIIAAGHYFSINPAMLASRTFASFISLVPSDRVLIESDGPHVKLKGRPARPSDIGLVRNCLQFHWAIPADEVDRRLEHNFRAVAGLPIS
jgi:TatD DNase family protein